MRYNWERPFSKIKSKKNLGTCQKFGTGQKLILWEGLTHQMESQSFKRRMIHDEKSIMSEKPRVFEMTWHCNVQREKVRKLGT